MIFAQLESFIASQSFAIPPVFRIFLTPSLRGFPAKSNLECFDSNFVLTMSTIYLRKQSGGDVSLFP